MVPERMVRYELAGRDEGIAAWYCKCGREDDRYYKLEYASSVYAERNIVQSGTNYDVLEKKDQRELLFSTREECLAYCEYLNEKNGVTGDTIYELDGEVYNGEEQLR